MRAEERITQIEGCQSLEFKIPNMVIEHVRPLNVKGTASQSNT